MNGPDEIVGDALLVEEFDDGIVGDGRHPAMGRRCGQLRLAALAHRLDQLADLVQLKIRGEINSFNQMVDFLRNSLKIKFFVSCFFNHVHRKFDLIASIFAIFSSVLSIFNKFHSF